MTFPRWLHRNRLPVLAVAFILTLAGVYAAISLPDGLFPLTSFPRIRIEVDAGSMPAKQMLIDVTEPLEAAARAVPGAVGVSSTTSRGSAEIFVDFPWGSDMNQALLSVDSAFAQKLPDLPQGTAYSVIQMSPNVIMPFVSYALLSDHVPLADLRQIARYQILPMLTGIPGIRRVGVLGGQTPEVEVSVTPQTLQAYGLTLADVAHSLSATNTVSAVGRLEDNALLYLAVSNNAFTSLDSVRNATVRTGKGGVMTLSQIAQVKMGSVPQWLLVNDNGHPAVTLDVYQQDRADSLSLAKLVSQHLDTFMKTQSKAIHLYKWYDQTQLVRSSIAALEEAIAIGLVFAAGVLFAFLRNWRVTAVAMIVVPMSVLCSVLILWLFGMTLNIMTLGGIAAAIGLLIDDVIVMIEHIARRAGHPDQEDPHAGVLHAAREFLSPLFGSTLATTIIFIPLAFLSGVTGAFFKFLSVTMASSLIISFLLTAFAAPLLARAMVDFTAWTDPGHGKDTWLRRTHARLLDALFRAPWLILPGLLVLGGAGYLAYHHVGTGFLPRMDEGGFVLDYYSAPGTSLAETNRELQQVEAILKSNPYVDTYSRRTGAGLGGDLTETYQGDFFVRLVDPSGRPNIWKVMDNISGKVTQLVPGINFDTHQLMSDMIGDMVGRRQPVVIQLSAKDPAVLGTVAGKVADAISRVPGVEPASVDDGVVPAGDALEIHVDLAAAALKGMTPAEIKDQIYHYLHGAVVTRYLGTVQDVGVRLWLSAPQVPIYRDTLGDLPIRAPNGQIFSLGTVASTHFISGQPQLTRDNLRQIVAVTAQISGSHDLGSTITAVRSALDRPGLIPAGVTYTFGGAYRQQQMAVQGMIKVFAAAVTAEIVLLLFLYRNLVIPLIIMATSLVSTGAVFIGLWATGVELNITAMMGMVMIIGIATEMAIFLVSEYQMLRQTMSAREALREAALNRLRPITMSTLAMILALVPLGAAISGSGDQMLQPLAIAIIAGASVQLPLVLLAMPVFIGLTTSDRTSKRKPR
ncbi:efflux RND transporter permease subunit [Paraburkholderia tagetis]|uniref:Efflux RND transporter permease subunit n=1 Tax=Paraburkholderia tagetis TaxID=2913261 RepID=A0A9X1UP06_9BURK|nr:efflux RND transporter permease subunit [Paraburkholderia tagetis]MCG5079002.1 efflux RND transporter permease subunit [Paraburkholderia tagetis]